MNPLRRLVEHWSYTPTEERIVIGMVVACIVGLLAFSGTLMFYALLSIW